MKEATRKMQMKKITEPVITMVTGASKSSSKSSSIDPDCNKTITLKLIYRNTDEQTLQKNRISVNFAVRSYRTITISCRT